MTENEIISTKTPFFVKNKRDGRIAVIDGFAMDDSVCLPVAIFKDGGFSLIDDVLCNWDMINSKQCK